jgi:hypothetical protein
MCLFSWSHVGAVGLKENTLLPREAGSLIPLPHLACVEEYAKGFNFTDIPEDWLYIPTLPSSIYSGMIPTHLSNQEKQRVMAQLSSDTGSILALAAGTITFLYFMPESVSKWPREKKDMSLGKLWGRYDDSVTKGPVWDRDKPEINYIGHPYFGAAYYTHAMEKNFTRLESLSYSFMMSACMYEYGLEAFFEYPSIQDLIVTPVAGAVVGELFISLMNTIRSNGEQVLGSKALGSVCMFILDPISGTLEPINRFNEKYSKMRMKANYFAKTSLSDRVNGTSPIYDHRFGFEISIYTEAFSR